MTVFGLPVRAFLDTKKIKSAEKRWNWVRRGAPLIVEIGPRDAAAGNVTYMRRDDLRDGDKVKSIAKPRVDFIEGAVQLLAEIQAGLYAEAKARLDGNIKCDLTSFEAVAAYFGEDDDSFKGWVRVAWSKPTGAALDAVEQKLKALKLTIRNAPEDQPKSFGACIFTGAAGTQEILIGRAY
ncbi:MAG: hypothetical protein ACXWLT_11665 [Rhizomicrobium sp.]